MKLNCALPLFLFLQVLPVRSSTEYIHDADYWSGWFSRPIWRQYTSFYYKDAAYFNSVSTGVCNTTLRLYNEAFDAPSSSDIAHRLLARCYQHEACILDNIVTDNLVNFQSASVMLGLMPTLLATIAPGIGEIGLLSAHRPILSFLVSMGAPGVWPTRVLIYEDTTTALRHDVNNDLDRFLMRPMPSGIGSVVGFLQYIFALGAIVNVLLTSIEVGQKTILTWGCTTQFLPLLWALIPCVVHTTAVLGYALTRQIENPTQQVDSPSAVNDQTLTLVATKPKNETVGDTMVTAYHASDVRGTHRTKIVNHMPKFFKRETTVCVHQKCTCLRGRRNASILATVLTLVASSLAFCHVLFGIMVFSSLQLVTMWDVFNRIMWRYILSVVCCRAILIIELAGIRIHR